MYTVLAVCVVLHQVVIVLKRKNTSIPLRGAAIRFIEFLGRTLSAPLAFIYYMVTFMDATVDVYAVFLPIVLGTMLFIFLKDWRGLKKSVTLASNSIQTKLDEKQPTTSFELLVMNFVSFGTLSTSTDQYTARLSRKARSTIALSRNIEMMERKKKELERDSDDEDC